MIGEEEALVDCPFSLLLLVWEPVGGVYVTRVGGTKDEEELSGRGTASGVKPPPSLTSLVDFKTPSLLLLTLATMEGVTAYASAIGAITCAAAFSSESLDKRGSDVVLVWGQSDLISKPEEREKPEEVEVEEEVEEEDEEEDEEEVNDLLNTLEKLFSSFSLISS
jgi:hypothetical protein